MVKINQISQTGEVSALQKSADQGSSKSAAIDVKGTNTDKKITQNNLDVAADMPPQKAIEYLIDNSPLGWTKPTTQDLESFGYTNIPVYGMGMCEFESPDGKISGNTDFGNNTMTYTYKTEKYTQKMVYDKDGNLVKGDLISKDLYGDTVDHLTVLVGADGKISYIR